MQNNLSAEGLYINDFHRENSMAAQRAVKRMLLHPYSREQKIEQIQMLHRMSASSKIISMLGICLPHSTRER